MLTNAERDSKLMEIHETVIRLEEKAHDPMSCPAMNRHEESHGRHVRWFFWVVGAVVGVTGAVIAIFKAGG